MSESTSEGRGGGAGTGPQDRSTAARDRDALRAYEKDLRQAERKVAGEIDPGGRAVVVAALVLVVMVSLVLPHAGNASGIDVLTMSAHAHQQRISLPSQIFVWMLAIFGIGFSMLALLTRRWVVAWVALCGCAVDSVAGMLAIWTRNTVGVGGLAPPSGAGAGLILGWIAVIALTFHWARVVWARSTYHMALEQERREQAAVHEAFNRALRDRRASGAPARTQRPDPEQIRGDDGESRPTE
ncbi:Rv2732c family membrane protein [Gordonia sp. (in: high G+C Gram-positive bacteria)]|uniref:Rv2732c family membrane protein n=1 Tax=unclassified Gordonia (in: high G+C Gram-positive bacteria) TaxID=2657482 RepID=UPI00352929EC